MSNVSKRFFRKRLRLPEPHPRNLFLFIKRLGSRDDSLRSYRFCVLYRDEAGAWTEVQMPLNILLRGLVETRREFRLLPSDWMRYIAES